MRNLEAILDTRCATGRTYREEIPPYTIESLERYRVHGIPTSDFLRCFMAGDLFGALERADEDNRKAMFPIYCFLRNHMPAACWGSKARVSDWLSDSALRGLTNQHFENASN